MTKARSNAVANAAKGDLTVGNGTDLSGILAVGSNGDTLVADSTTSTGLRYNPQNALANPIINGGFDIWQRGTTFNNITGLIYTADRFQGSIGSMTSGNLSISRQTSGLAGLQYALRFQRNVSSTTTGNGFLTYSLDSVSSIPMQGKTITVSFYARAGANYSPSGSGLQFFGNTGTGTDENINNGFTGQVTVVNQTSTLTTSWQRFAYSFSFGSSANQIGLYWQYTGVGTAGANDWYEITGVQFDTGTYTASSAPSFRRSGGTIQGELAACQRYYYRVTPSVTNGAFSVGNNFSTTINTSVIYPKVTLRSTPTLETSGTASNYRVNTAGTGFTCSAVPVIDQTSTDIIALNATVASGLTVGNAGILIALNGGTSILAFSSEL